LYPRGSVRFHKREGSVRFHKREEERFIVFFP
jgi:hypothetical protein